VHVVATAGHVDHGKSTLVLGLTGMDPDRFAEEKARGLTIDLGFAWTQLPSGREMSFVDVPGHVRFIKNMLAGVGAVDACLFVVAATEGWKPQSEEHLRILSLLGVSHGVVALTKVGLVDDDWRALARLDVVDRVTGTFLEGAPIVEVDVPAGIGVSALRTSLDEMLGTTPMAEDRGRARLWVDRAFAAKGSGTVVTGTLTGGAFTVDDEVVLLPRSTRVRIRSLQTHKTTITEAAPGRRLAVNLTGVSHHDVARGDVIVGRNQWEPSDTVDCSLQVLPSLAHEVTRRGAYEAYVGSGEHAVRLRVLGAAAIAPGEAGLVRLHLPVRLPLLPGDRYVLRESGRAETVGGGEVLDVAPVLPAAKARPTRSIDRVIAERGWVEADLLERLTGERRPPTVGRWVLSDATLDRAVTTMRDDVAAAGALGLDLARLDELHRAVLATLDDIVVAGGRATIGAPSDVMTTHPYVAAVRASLFTPPAPDGVDRHELRELVRRGLVVERDGVWFAPEAVSAAAAEAASLLAIEPAGFTVAALRERLGTTRKYLIPLVAHLDATGVTRRRGDLRVAGPLLPPPPDPS
jgi:selenocysteine-specific elongation factor